MLAPPASLWGPLRAWGEEAGAASLSSGHWCFPVAGVHVQTLNPLEPELLGGHTASLSAALEPCSPTLSTRPCNSAHTTTSQHQDILTTGNRAGAATVMQAPVASPERAQGTHQLAPVPLPAQLSANTRVAETPVHLQLVPSEPWSEHPGLCPLLPPSRSAAEGPSGQCDGAPDPLISVTVATGPSRPSREFLD